jgi:inner membrane protein
MDSLTQILLGASVAALAAPARNRRAALLAGAALGTLPDLDVLPLAFIDDPVTRMTWHRSFSHSLLVLLPLAWLIWYGLRRVWTPVREAPGPWFRAIALALLTHPLLDAHTVYGTQLWWPLPVAPTMWSTIFIIDPHYTVPLLLGAVVAWFGRDRPIARTLLVAGLVLSNGYLAWSWVAKAQVDARAGAMFAAMGLGDAPRFSVPANFTTWHWRVVALTPDGHVEAYLGPFGPEPPNPPLVASHDRELMARLRRDLPAAARMDWFTRGFVAASSEEGAIVVTDLRMGAHPAYVFRFALADATGAPFVPPHQMPGPEINLERVRAMWP